jgi:hypothetical protein
MLGARIRRIFRAEPADVVEEVAWARAAIWGRAETPDEVLGREFLPSLVLSYSSFLPIEEKKRAETTRRLEGN